MATYDKYYKKKDYFGSPCKGLIDLFEAYPTRGSLCDLGAGQGRDSIPLQRMGYLGYRCGYISKRIGADKG